MATDLQPAKTARAAKYDSFADEQLARAVARIRALDLTAACLGLVALGLAYALAVVLLDSWLVLPSLIRQLAFAGFVLGAAAYLVYFVVRPLRRHLNPFYAARRLEQTLPGAKNSVINWLDLRRRGLPDAIETALSHRAAKDLAKTDVDRAVSTRRTSLVGGVTAGMLIGLAILFLAGPRQFASLLYRAFAPFTEGTIASRTQISIVQPENGDVTVAIGKAVHVAAWVQGKIPDPNKADAVRLLFRYNPSDPYQERALERGDDAHDWATTVPAAQVRNGFWYKVAGGDAETPEYRVQVRSAPLLTGFDVTYHYRPYLAWRDETNHDPNLRGPRGTDVVLVARTNRHVRDGQISLDGEAPVPSERVPDDPQALRFKLVLEKDQTYRVWFTSSEGERNAEPMPYTIRVVADRAPQVKLTKPGNVTLPGNGLLQAEGSANDDFGVASMTLHMAIKDGPALKSKPYRAGKSFKLPDGSYPQMLEYRDVVELEKVQDDDGRPFALLPGMLVRYWLEATDGCDYPKPNVGKSEEFVVTIQAKQPDQAKQEKEREQAKKDQQQHENKQDQKLEQDAKNKEPQPPKDESKEDQPKDDKVKEQAEKLKDALNEQRKQEQQQNPNEPKKDEGQPQEKQGDNQQKKEQGSKDNNAEQKSGKQESNSDGKPPQDPGKPQPGAEQPKEGNPQKQDRGDKGQPKTETKAEPKAGNDPNPNNKQPKADQPKADGKQGEQSKADGKPGEQQKGDGKPQPEDKQPKADGKPQLGEPSKQDRKTQEGQPKQDGKQQEGQPKQDGKQQEGQPKDGKQGDQPNPSKGGEQPKQDGQPRGDSQKQQDGKPQPGEKAQPKEGTQEKPGGDAKAQTGEPSKQGDDTPPPKQGSSQDKGEQQPKEGAGKPKDKAGAQPKDGNQSKDGQQPKEGMGDPKKGEDNQPKEGNDSKQGSGEPKNGQQKSNAGQPDQKRPQPGQGEPKQGQTKSNAGDKPEDKQAGQGEPKASENQKPEQLGPPKDGKPSGDDKAARPEDKNSSKSDSQAKDEAKTQTDAKKEGETGKSDDGKPGQEKGSESGSGKPMPGDKSQSGGGKPMPGDKSPGEGGQPMPGGDKPAGQQQPKHGEGSGQDGKPADGAPKSDKPGQPGKDQGDQGGKPGGEQGKQGQQGKADDGKPQPGANRGGSGKPGQGGDRQGEQPTGDNSNPGGADTKPDELLKPDEENAKKAGVLQLEDFKKHVNPDVLKKANMTEEEYRQFLRAYEEMLKRQGQLPEEKEKLVAPQKGNALAGQSTRRIVPGAQNKAGNLSRSGRALPPEGFREIQNEFSKKLSERQRAAEKK